MHPLMITFFIATLHTGVSLLAQQDQKVDPQRAGYERAMAVFRGARDAYRRKLLEQANGEAAARLSVTENPAIPCAARLFAIVAADPKSDVSRSALFWIVRQGIPADSERALACLSATHSTDQKIAAIIAFLEALPSIEGPRLLQSILEEHPSDEVRGRACLALGRERLNVLDFRSRLDDASTWRESIIFYGPGIVNHVRSLDPKACRKQAGRLLERALREYGAVALEGYGTIAEAASSALFELRGLGVGNPAPDIKGEDLHGKPLRLSGHRGRVVLLDFWGHW